MTQDVIAYASQDNQVNITLLLSVSLLVIVLICITLFYFVNKRINKKNEEAKNKKAAGREKYISKTTDQFLKDIKLFIEESIERVDNYDSLSNGENLGDIKKDVLRKLQDFTNTYAYKEVTTMSDLKEFEELVARLKHIAVTNWKSKLGEDIERILG